MFKKYFFVFLYFLSPLFLIGTIYYSNPIRYEESAKMTIAMILGATAYTWLVLEFVLSARPKFAEKYFGMDKFYRFHGWMAVVSLCIVYLHETYIGKWGGQVREYGDLAFNIFISITVFTLIFMVDSIILKIKPVLKVKKLFEKIRLFKYEHYVLVHTLTVVGLVVMYLHVLSTSNAKEYLSVTIGYTVYFALGLSFYLYHKVFKILILRNRRFIVKDIIKESENMWTLKLVPENGHIFDYKPGQFGFFRILGKNVKPEEHPFSISSEPGNKNYLSIMIKELGDYTSKIKNVNNGDKVFVDGPYGKFSYVDYPKEDRVVLIAGGVGITPVLSMLRDMMARNSQKSVTLIWGARSRSDLICINEFKEMQNVMKNFEFVPVLSEDEAWEGEKGNIDKEKLDKIINKDLYKQVSTGLYICGPTPMLNSILKSLKELKFNKKQIHFEKFSL